MNSQNKVLSGMTGDRASSSSGAQFTPGPWIYRGNGLVTMEGISREWIANLTFGTDAPNGPRQVHADGRLIAAAPELYEALREAERVMVEVDPTADDNWKIYRVAIDKARAALKKAVL